MGYIGIRTTGSDYGYRHERRAYSNRIRRRDDIIEARVGLSEYLARRDDAEPLLDESARRRRRSKARPRKEWRHRYHIALIARGRSAGGCDHPECRAAAVEARLQRIENQRRLAIRLASGEIAKLLGS
jgi:hypothetical protein